MVTRRGFHSLRCWQGHHINNGELGTTRQSSYIKSTIIIAELSFRRIKKEGKKFWWQTMNLAIDFLLADGDFHRLSITSHEPSLGRKYFLLLLFLLMLNKAFFQTFEVMLKRLLEFKLQVSELDNNMVLTLIDVKSFLFLSLKNSHPSWSFLYNFPFLLNFQPPLTSRNFEACMQHGVCLSPGLGGVQKEI